MTIFLGLSKRYRKALETFDPMSGEWLFRILDPWPGGTKDARPAWRRIAMAVVLLFAPMVLLSALPSTTFGMGLRGKQGFFADIGIYGIFLFFVAFMALIPVGRRLIGDLIGELVLLGIARPMSPRFSPRRTPKGKVLRFFEWLSRVDKGRGLISYGFFVLWMLNVYRLLLADGKPGWMVSPQEPGTFLHIFSIRGTQPNLAGIWHLAVFAPVACYLILLAARLIVVFACLCAELAGDRELAINPGHPDGTGGLKPVGQVALFLSVSWFVLGVDLAGITANELMKAGPVLGGSIGSSNLHLQVILWCLYLTVGCMLFFLPLLPLRARMAAAKRQYLLDLLCLLAVAERSHQETVQKVAFRPNSLQGQVALNALIQQASDMAVWPFDKKTFVRYTSLLLSPLAPLVANRLPSMIEWMAKR